MPYHVTRSGECPASKPWAVVKDADGDIMGCHATERDADQQMAALYANEPAAARAARQTEQLQARAAEYLAGLPKLKK